VRIQVALRGSKVAQQTVKGVSAETSGKQPDFGLIASGRLQPNGCVASALATTAVTAGATVESKSSVISASRCGYTFQRLNHGCNTPTITAVINPITKVTTGISTMTHASNLKRFLMGISPPAAGER
jgi:hypothetical protein